MLFTVILIASAIICRTIGGCVSEHRPCETPNGTQGYCVASKYCPYIDTITQYAPHDLSDFIQKSICGYDEDKSLLFCCDINRLTAESQAVGVVKNAASSSSQSVENNVQDFTQSNNILTSNGSTIQEHTEITPAHTTQSVTPINCRTPNGEQAQCISIRDCPRILSILSINNTNEDEKRYVRESKCGFKDGNHLVCCGLDVNFRPSNEGDENSSIKYNHLIPTNKCGQESRILEEPVAIESRRGYSNLNFTLPNRIFGGNDAEVHEFPWMALLTYQNFNNDQLIFNCGGSLITSRYVLTAAHCILGPQVVNLVSVRLGEWNYNNTGRDCVLTSKGRLCIDAPIDVTVESIHPHPEYDITTREKYNDIGLVRLNRNIKFTDHIIPICLPNASEHLIPGERLTISGWGIKSYNEPTSIKQKVDVPIISRSQCSVMFERSFQIRKLGKGQICAGGEEGKDSCVGDSGAPLMKLSNSTLTGPARWKLEGIVSFGIGCGQENLYGVYTKISHYIGWIHKTIVP